MGRKRKDRSKDNYPAKNQATILNFKGFKRSVQSNTQESPEIKTPQFCCEFCGLSHCHDGARKKHQSSCDRKPVETKDFYCKKCTSVLPVNDATEVVVPILDEILKLVCMNKSGGWNLAKIFTMQPSKKKEFKEMEKSSGAKSNKTDENIEKTSSNVEETKNGKHLSTEPYDVHQPPTKKSRKSYSYVEQAEILRKYLSEKAKDQTLSLSTFGKELGVTKSMLHRWLKDKEQIFQNSYDQKVRYLKKGRGSNKHDRTFPKLYCQFITARERGRKISFNWLWIRGKKISTEIGAPMFTSSATQLFLRKYNIKVRRGQRTKQKPKGNFEETLRNWHSKFRECVIKSHSSHPSFHEKWGRYMPHQRLNLDQVPLPFVLDNKTTYETPLGRNEKCWIACPGSGLDKRQCSLQICFSPENNQVRTEIIFRGTGKNIKQMEKRSYHKSVDVFWQRNAWADTQVSCEWVKKTLKSAVPEGEEFLLVCDNLGAQTSIEFKESVREINGIVWFGPPGENLHSK